MAGGVCMAGGVFTAGGVAGIAAGVMLGVPGAVGGVAAVGGGFAAPGFVAGAPAAPIICEGGVITSDPHPIKHNPTRTIDLYVVMLALRLPALYAVQTRERRPPGGMLASLTA